MDEAGAERLGSILGNAAEDLNVRVAVAEVPIRCRVLGVGVGSGGWQWPRRLSHALCRRGCGYAQKAQPCPIGIRRGCGYVQKAQPCPIDKPKPKLKSKPSIRANTA